MVCKFVLGQRVCHSRHLCLYSDVCFSLPCLFRKQTIACDHSPSFLEIEIRLGIMAPSTLRPAEEERTSSGRQSA